jgi:hypothetical protein
MIILWVVAIGLAVFHLQVEAHRPRRVRIRRYRELWPRKIPCPKNTYHRAR